MGGKDPCPGTGIDWDVERDPARMQLCYRRHQQTACVCRDKMYRQRCNTYFRLDRRDVQCL